MLMWGKIFIGIFVFPLIYNTEIHLLIKYAYNVKNYIYMYIF